MSKINLRLSYKNILILKHSLKGRIKGERAILDRFEGSGIAPDSPLWGTYQGMYQKIKKENEEHRRCYDALIQEMKVGGYRYGGGKESNVFGEKYLPRDV